jgi:hypothetical protein
VSEIVDTFTRAGFGGIQFPWTKIAIKGGLDHHVHKYIHRPGAEIENLARKPYEVKFSAELHTTLRKWQNAYPGTLAQLIALFELGETRDLAVPNYFGGTLPCKCVDWSRNLDAKRRSGESVEFTFLEDSTAQFANLNAIFVVAAQSFAAQIASLNRLGQGLPSSSIFDKLKQAMGLYLAIESIAEVAFEYISNKLDPIIAACEALDALLFFQDPKNYYLLDLIRDIWDTAVTVNLDALRRSLPMETFFTQRVMTVGEVSLEIYSNLDHAIEILQLNPIDDALAIPPGKFLRHYATF